MAEALTFIERSTCPVCDSADADVLWSGKLDDADVIARLSEYSYSGPWRAQIVGQTFCLCQCARCSMKWHRHVIDDSAVATVYGTWADAEQAKRFEAAHVTSKHDRKAMRVQMAKLVLRLDHLAEQGARPLRLLDFGCGDGDFLSVARAMGADALGIDVSASRTQAARGDGLTILPDLEALDAQDGPPLDAVVLSQVLEHIAAPKSLLRALHQRLRPGGVLFVAVPNTKGVSVPQDFHEFTLVQPVEHMNAFTPDTLRQIGRNTGFLPLRRPAAFVTTKPTDALRSAANWIHDPKTTDVFFRAVEATTPTKRESLS